MVNTVLLDSSDVFGSRVKIVVNGDRHLLQTVSNFSKQRPFHTVLIATALDQIPVLQRAPLGNF